MMFKYRVTLRPEHGAPINSLVICSISELDEKIYTDVLIGTNTENSICLEIQFTIELNHIVNIDDLKAFKNNILVGYEDVHVIARYIGPSLNLSEDL